MLQQNKKYRKYLELLLRKYRKAEKDIIEKDKEITDLKNQIKANKKSERIKDCINLCYLCVVAFLSVISYLFSSRENEIQLALTLLPIVVQFVQMSYTEKN